MQATAESGRVLSFPKTYTVFECCNCGVAYAVTTDFERRRREDGTAFYCPRGHSQVFTKTEVQKLKEQLAAKQAEAERAHARANAHWAEKCRAENRAKAYRGAVTKIRKRVAAGVCPCCRRNFQNLARHISDQHPKFGKGRAKK